MSSAISLRDFWTKLDNHDWFYSYSDDNRVWRAGETAEANLREIAKQSPEHRELYDAFRSHMFSGSGFGKEKLPKPEQPK